MRMVPVKSYEYRHVVAFEETNLLGNVYYVNHLRWQGRCRELFLQEKAPDVLEEIRSGLLLVTTRCSCEYYAELSAFDEVIVQMRLARLAGQRMDLRFEYYRSNDGRDELVASGFGGRIVLLARPPGYGRSELAVSED